MTMWAELQPGGVTRAREKLVLKKKLERAVNERNGKVLGSGFPPAGYSTAMRLVRGGDTGTDLMVTYQRPLGSAPPTLRGPI